MGGIKLGSWEFGNKVCGYAFRIFIAVKFTSEIKMNDNLSCSSRQSYASYGPMELIKRAPIQREIDLKIFDSQQRAPMSGCVYRMQRPIDVAGGQTLFNVYKKFLSKTLVGKLLRNNDLVPAHGYLNFPNGQNLGYGDKGVLFEKITANSEAVSACINLADVLDRLPGIVAGVKDYHLTQNNCQMFATSVARTEKQDNFKIIKDYASEFTDRAKRRVTGALSKVKDAMISGARWTSQALFSFAYKVAPFNTWAARKILGR